MKSNAQNYPARSININKMIKRAPFAIQPVSTGFDLAGMISACLPDASVLPTAVNGSACIPVLSIMAYGHIPEAVPAGVHR
jgi:hypothetical protein